MNDRERQQTVLISDHAVGQFRGGLEARIQMIFSAHSAKGLLHSGATIRASVRGMDELIVIFADELKKQISDIALDMDAFAILSKAVDQALDICAAQLLPVTRMASGRLQGPVDQSNAKASQELFDEMRANVIAKLAISRFAFEPPPSSAVHPQPESLQPTTETPGAVKWKGGRPPAEFWDDMWASIATALYDGTLKPKTQADVERAMADWIESNGHNAAGSTVRARARRLWDRLSATDG